MIRIYNRNSLLELESLKYNKSLISLYNSIVALSPRALFIVIVIIILIYLSFDVYSSIIRLRKTSLIKITKTGNKLTEFRINLEDRLFSNRLINRDKTSGTILVLLDLYLNSMLNRYRYSNTRIRRRLSFFVEVVFILL